MTQQKNHLENLYNSHLENLQLLQSQKVGYGNLNVPIHIINQINAEVEEILRLCKLLNKEIPDEVKIEIESEDVKEEKTKDGVILSTSIFEKLRINLFWFKTKAVLLENKGFVWGLAGIALGLVGLGWRGQSLPLLLQSLAIYCGYKAKLSGNRKIGILAISLGVGFIIIRIAFLIYGVTHPGELEKTYNWLFGIRHLFSLIFIIIGWGCSFIQFIRSVFWIRNIRSAGKWLICIIFTSLLLYIFTSDAVRGYLKKVLTGI